MTKPSAGSESGAGALSRSALLLAPEPPYPCCGGGHFRTASLVEYLARRYALDVITFRQPGEADPRKAFPRGLARHVSVIDLPHHSRKAVSRAARNIARVIRRDPPLNDRFAGFEREVVERLEGRRYDVAVIEHFWCAPYFEQVSPHAGAVYLDLHNIESDFYARQARCESGPAAPVYSTFARAALRLERKWLPRFFAVLAASEDDAATLRRIAPDTPVSVFPNTIPCVDPISVPEENVVVFSGNLEYQPNISAVRFFRSEVWPLLRTRWTGLRWRLVGRNSHAVAGLLRGDARIELTGPVNDALSELAAARVVVVPLLSGSGTRIKILEAWAAGRAVVSTRLGAEGLPARDGEHLLLADTAREFAAAVSRLLASPDERARIGASGRRLFECNFTWNHAWQTLQSIGL